MALYVGCDLGTMGTKSAVVDETGAVIASAFAPVSLTTARPGWVEQDLREIERTAHQTIARAVSESGRCSEIRAVAVSGQMSGIGAVDAEFEPVFAFDSWLDSRCEPEVVELHELRTEMTRLSGCPPTYSHAPKIRSWARRLPGQFGSIAKLVVPGSFVAARLAGLNAKDAFLDTTYLHFTNVADTVNRQWSSELVEATGLRDDWLPRIVEPFDIIGAITDRAADATGIPVGTPIAAGAGDQAAAQLGAAAVRPGQAFDTAGTASVLAACTDDFRPDDVFFRRLAARGVIPDSFVSLAFINGGGLALQWFRDTFAPELADRADAYRVLDERAERIPPGSERLLWYPHFQGQVLPPNLHARGAWIGVTSTHTLAHLYRAILEGIACEYALWATDMGALTETRAIGGGSRSTLWNQIKANTVGVAWRPTTIAEVGISGDALIAASAVGDIADVAATAESWQTLEDSVQPMFEDIDRIQGTLAAYRTLADGLDEALRALDRASSASPQSEPTRKGQQ